MAIEWLDDLRNKEKPFMLMSQDKGLHRSWLPAQEYLDEFMNKPIPLPETLFNDYSGEGTAAKEAEMRIKELMGLTKDNKIKPEIVDELGLEQFLQ